MEEKNIDGEVIDRGTGLFTVFIIDDVCTLTSQKPNQSTQLFINFLIALRKRTANTQYVKKQNTHIHTLIRYSKMSR